MNDSVPKYEVLIVGGGVVGTALLYTLSKYTNVRNIGLIEKYDGLGTVNSPANMNSQTLHFGDIETNYTFEKAKNVKHMADMVMKYVEKEKERGGERKLFSKYPKMVLAVGKDQVAGLRERFTLFSQLFPTLRVIEREEIGRIEPRILEGRDPDQELVALATEDGYTVDFQNLSHSFAEKAKESNPELELRLSTKLLKIEKASNHYVVTTNKGDIHASVVVFAAGGHSLMYAKSLGYGTNYSILSVAGSFYTGPKVLNGKVYTIQVAKLPFAAIHGDPEVHNQDITRFGPTAKPIFRLERYNRKTIRDYWKTFGLGFQPVVSLLKILTDPVLFKYISLNFLYDIPFIGKRLFIKQIRTIVPGLKLSEINYAKGVGGTRPQVVNNTTRKLEMGEAKLTGDNIIFNITPSPGASTCLGNSYKDTVMIMDFLDNRYKFNKEAFERDLM